MTWETWVPFVSEEVMLPPPSALGLTRYMTGEKGPSSDYRWTPLVVEGVCQGALAAWHDVRGSGRAPGKGPGRCVGWDREGGASDRAQLKQPRWAGHVPSALTAWRQRHDLSYKEAGTCLGPSAPLKPDLRTLSWSCSGRPQL